MINIGSVAGHRGSRSVPMLAHAATKGGVIAMTRQMAVEGEPHGIRAVSISPGTIETAGTAELLAQPVVRDGLLAQILVPRLGRSVTSWTSRCSSPPTRRSSTPASMSSPTGHDGVLSTAMS